MKPFLLCALLPLTSTALAQPQVEAAKDAGWTRTRVDASFRSEGAAVADVNRDGKPDILVGDFWYQAPRWERHEIRQPSDLGDGAKSYSRAFCVFADDVDGDGWVDQVVIGFPGEASLWYQNPRGVEGRWKERVVWPSACNESPQFADLLGDGKRRLVMGVQPEGQMIWLSPNADLEKPWDKHPISEPSAGDKRTFGTDRYDHGLGVGDINGDGRADVLVRQGWWEQPADAKSRTAPWAFHEGTLSGECADMHAVDMDGDGQSDVLSSSAHSRGVWWHRQLPQAAEAGPGWKREVIDSSFTQSHALLMADLDGDGAREIITGKRFWAHGPDGDEDPGAPAVTVVIAIGRDANGAPKFAPRVIDDQTGVGTQFSVADMDGDGRPDIVVSNKKGVTILAQAKR